MGHLPFQARKLIREVNEGKRRQDRGQEKVTTLTDGDGMTYCRCSQPSTQPGRNLKNSRL